MKTFYEWLEVNEANFFSNLFRAKKQTLPQNVNQETPEEKERKRQSDAHDDAMRILVPGYKPSENKTSPSQPNLPKISQPNQQNKPSTASNFPKSGGTTLFDQLYGLVGDKILPIQRMRSESDHSLKNASNLSRVREAYSWLSRAKNYGDNNYGLSDSEIDKSIQIIEKMFKDELGAVSFPDEEVVVPYAKPDWDPKDYHINDAGISSLEEPAKVIVKGFKYGGRTVKAVVSIDAFKRDRG
jgi:hypothetical protein